LIKALLFFCAILQGGLFYPVIASETQVTPTAENLPVVHLHELVKDDIWLKQEIKVANSMNLDSLPNPKLVLENIKKSVKLFDNPSNTLFMKMLASETLAHEWSLESRIKHSVENKASYKRWRDYFVNGWESIKKDGGMTTDFVAYAPIFDSEEKGFEEMDQALQEIYGVENERKRTSSVLSLLQFIDAERDSSGGIVFSGKVNLPEGTKLMATLRYNGEKKMLGQDKCEVQSLGIFKTEPFTNDGEAWPSGKYDIEILCFFNPNYFSDTDELVVFGEDGKNIKDHYSDVVPVDPQFPNGAKYFDVLHTIYLPNQLPN